MSTVNNVTRALVDRLTVTENERTREGIQSDDLSHSAKRVAMRLIKVTKKNTNIVSSDIKKTVNGIFLL